MLRGNASRSLCRYSSSELELLELLEEVVSMFSSSLSVACGPLAEELVVVVTVFVEAPLLFDAAVVLVVVVVVCWSYSACISLRC